MSRPLVPFAQLRSAITVYLAEEEREQLEARARKSGLHLSAFIRKAALGQKIEVPNVDAIRLWAELGGFLIELDKAISEVNQSCLMPPIASQFDALIDKVATLRHELLTSSGGGK